MNGYAVEPAALRDCDAALGTVAAQARTALAQLRVCAAGVHSSWHGPAAAAFRDGWTQWLAGITTMLEALDELAALLGASGSAYVDTEAAVRTSLIGGAR